MLRERFRFYWSKEKRYVVFFISRSLLLNHLLAVLDYNTLVRAVNILTCKIVNWSIVFCCYCDVGNAGRCWHNSLSWDNLRRVPEYILNRAELVQILLSFGFPSSFAETVTVMPSTVQVVALLKSPS